MPGTRYPQLSDIVRRRCSRRDRRDHKSHDSKSVANSKAKEKKGPKRQGKKGEMVDGVSRDLSDKKREGRNAISNSTEKTTEGERVPGEGDYLETLRKGRPRNRRKEGRRKQRKGDAEVGAIAYTCVLAFRLDNNKMNVIFIAGDAPPGVKAMGGVKEKKCRRVLCSLRVLFSGVGTKRNINYLCRRHRCINHAVRET